MRSIDAVPVASHEDPLDELRSLPSRLAEEDLQGLPGSALADRLLALRKGIDKLEAEFSRSLRAFERSQAHTAAGALSAASWLRSHCRLSPRQAAEQVRVARHLEELPETAQAFAGGEIGFRHAAVIARTAEAVGTAAGAEAEPILVQAARQLDPRRLRLVSWHLRHCLDPDGALADANRTYERRRLHLSETLDGLFVLDGLLDALPRGPHEACFVGWVGRRPPAHRPPGPERPAQRRRLQDRCPAASGRAGGAGPAAAAPDPDRQPDHPEEGAGSAGGRPGLGPAGAGGDGAGGSPATPP